jgi:hypothetical protein
MSKYQPESHAANVSANLTDSNGRGKGRVLAAGNSTADRNAVPLRMTWTLSTATRASSAAVAQGVRCPKAAERPRT